jgi:transposase
MATANLFGESQPPETPRSAPQRTGEVRLRKADRKQVRLVPQNIDQLLALGHRARDVWELVNRLDLSAFHDDISSRGSTAGRPAIDPAILLSLWVFATCEGVGSARQLERLCIEHDAYRWICGGVPVSHKTLSEFRRGHETKLDDLLTQLIAALMKNGILTLKTVAQDGTKIRAAAGASSFHRRATLEQNLEAASQQVETLKKHVDAEGSTTPPRKQAAQQRAAEDRERRVREALKNVEEVEQTRRNTRKKTSPPRASTTDPEARIMKMSGGGFRPAYNGQLAVDTDTRIIVAARVSNSGGDMGQVDETLAEIERRAGKKPESYLMDGGFAKPEDIEKLATKGIQVFAPPPKRRDGGDPHAPREEDSEPLADWRARMATDDAKETYKTRASTIETINGDLKAHRGLERLRVRGLRSAQCVLLFAALTYNLLTVRRIFPDLLIG